MLRYPECVWSRVEELGHIEIIGRHGKALEGAGNCWKLWKTLEASEHVAGDILEGLCDRSGDVTVCDMFVIPVQCSLALFSMFASLCNISFKSNLTPQKPFKCPHLNNPSKLIQYLLPSLIYLIALSILLE